MALQALLPDPDCLTLESLSIQGNDVVFTVSTIGDAVACPLCGATCQRVHSRYQRTLADLPWQANPVKILMTARKFFCDNDACTRSIFTEPIATVTARYGRKTKRLVEALEALALMAGGEVAARIAKVFGLTLSPDYLLEGIKKAPSPSASAPRVVGIDDFAFKRGHVYGSIVVDLERRKPIDLLPDREAATVAQWLAQHPSIEIISRDRGAGYKEGATTGAPQAVQVADRWHLLKNLGDALECLLKRHHRQLREAAGQVTKTEPVNIVVPPVNIVVPVEASAALRESLVPCESPSLVATKQNRSQRHQELSRQRREQSFLQVHQLRQEGFNISAIGQQTGLARQTIRKYLETSTCPEYSPRPVKSGLLTPYYGYLNQRFAQGCHNAATLLVEIRAQGYRGKVSILRQYLRQFRASAPAGNAQGFKIPSACSVRWWLLGHYHSRDPEQESLRHCFVATLLDHCPEISAAQELVLEFVELLKERRADSFDAWMSRAQACSAPEIASFAKGLLQDEDAVREAIFGKWSNGQVEGQVNRLKYVKRSMYGRGGFALLRARVLHRRAA